MNDFFIKPLITNEAIASEEKIMKKLTNSVRALALILALILIVSITPVIASAAGWTTPTPREGSFTIPLQFPNNQNVTRGSGIEVGKTLFNL